ncbi:MRN complex-interacting protein-like [Chenopodium quinoa]|uniref:MRN complex-interacting protein-like n=1 Tax=Chenopodium quinoa TaxID=63459 RepID=UPI000B793B05|nr:MRN complex-interacting protein-like [Chenopodium quinoa]
MFKLTLFIAVKCCQCSTMQVKQQKKSSNKWNCVVCNQKQSVTKIYAQSHQAKDVRNVVQSFNMSRKLEDELQEVPSLGHFVEQLDGVQEAGQNKGKRRTDWTEYIEDKENVEPAYLRSKLSEEGMATEAIVVTEFSEDLMFKKPKLKGKFGSNTSIGLNKNQSLKPNFTKRVQDECISDGSGLINNVRRYSEEPEQNKVLGKMKTGSSKWPRYTAKDDFTEGIGRKQQQPNKSKGMMKANSSKWSEYMTEDDDGCDDKEVRAGFADDMRLMCGYKLENDGFDQLIEEDIHPDFM